MASQKKVGNSVSEFLQDMSEYEFTCPICFEDFKEPKSLPNCAHSVCLQCLEKMHEQSFNCHFLECPVCRVRSRLTSQGVKAWPTNTLIVRLMERSPVRQDKVAIKNAIENCRKVCESSAKTDGERNVVTERVRRKVEQKAQVLVEFIRDQERSLLDKIDEVMPDWTENVQLREQARELTERAESIVDRGDVNEIGDAKDSIVNQLEKVTKELNPGSQNIENDLREIAQEEKPPACQDAKDISQVLCPQNATSLFDPKYNRVLTKRRKIENFFPFDVATTVDGDLVVLDSRFQNVTIFSEDGNHKSQFKVGFEDLWGVTVSNKDEVVILSNSPKEFCGYLLYYDLNGNFLQKKTTEELKNIFLTGISIDSNNNFVITAGMFSDELKNYSRGGILVLSSDLQFKFSTLVDQTNLNLRKAVHFQGEYFCSELKLPGKEGCIKVFDNKGKVVREFGHKELHEPHGLVVDTEIFRVLVCDRQLNAILVYQLDGTYVTKFATKDDPVQITLTKNKGNIVVTCYLGLCIQILNYKWFLEVIDKSLIS